MSDRLERMWAAWRGDYVRTALRELENSDDCPLCAVLEHRDGETAFQMVHLGETAAVILNAFPYTSGHVLVLPLRHEGRLTALDDRERVELYDLVHRTVGAVERAYRPHGVNVGMNLGRAAGAGIPDHLHAHVVPRWSGDTNFMTPIAGARVLPETLEETGDRLRDAWV